MKDKLMKTFGCMSVYKRHDFGAHYAYYVKKEDSIVKQFTNLMGTYQWVKDNN